MEIIFNLCLLLWGCLRSQRLMGLTVISCIWVVVGKNYNIDLILLNKIKTTFIFCQFFVFFLWLSTLTKSCMLFLFLCWPSIWYCFSDLFDDFEKLKNIVQFQFLLVTNPEVVMLTASYVFKNILRCFENCCNSQQFYNVYLEVSESLYYSMWIFQIKKKKTRRKEEF